ncbi:MAG: hypothetical protein K8L97_33055 [Anaerolineae bacterium]|nr:hypothetical protein [Anaerolineae bacterium]
MSYKEALLKRLDEIGRSLEKTGKALALLGLGSVGTELDRIDDYSDLDFFAIVKPGFKQSFMDDLGWLEGLNPIAYRFKNTPDGYKLSYEDGIFCEFAVFEPDEMKGIPFAAGRIVWKDAMFDEAILVPTQPKADKKLNVERQVGEALTNLYIGLGRYRRGEKLSGARFVQGYALDRVLELSVLVETEQPAYRDIFTLERRYEQRFPITSQELGAFMQGYERTPESAAAILSFLERHFEVNPAIKKAIIDLLTD